MADGEAANTTENSDNYTSEMRRRARRITDDARRYRAWANILLAIGVLGAATIALGELIVGPQLWPKLIAAVVLIVAVGHYTKYLLIHRLPLRCPSCDGSFELNSDWECGWCDSSKQSSIMQTVLNDRVLTEPCKSCGEVATAVTCPECNQPVVFDPARFNETEQHGHMHPGLARLL